MTRAARVYDFIMPANGTFNLPAEGSLYRIQSATGAVEVRRDGGSIVGPLLPGQGERAEFRLLTITDKSGAANVGTILVADDNFIDARIAGQTQVRAYGVSSAIDGKAFVFGDTTLGVPGEYSYAEIWNPIGTGKRAIAGSASMSSGTGSAYSIRRTSAVVTAAVAPASKSSVAGVSVLLAGVGSNAALIGTQLERYLQAASQTLQVNFQEPYIVEPGSGLLIQSTTANTSLHAGWSWVEERI